MKAGYGSEVIPLINESTLVNTSSKNMILSSTLIKWLGERDLTADARMLCLEEGYNKYNSLKINLSPASVLTFQHFVVYNTQICQGRKLFDCDGDVDQA